jgi:hypothetical protein
MVRQNRGRSRGVGLRSPPAEGFRRLVHVRLSASSFLADKGRWLDKLKHLVVWQVPHTGDVLT